MAGFRGETLFNRGAVDVMQRVTHGTPRLVNIIAHKALLLAFGEGRQQVRGRHVRLAAADTPEARRDYMMWGWGIAALVVAVAAIGWMLQQ